MFAGGVVSTGRGFQLLVLLFAVALPVAAALAVTASGSASATPKPEASSEARRVQAEAERAQDEADATRVPGHYIVVLEDAVEHPGAVAEAQTEKHDGDLGFVYRFALKGYSAELSKAAVEAVRQDPRVKFVTPDRRETLESQTIPTGIDRIYAPGREDLDIDETDDVRVNADVAVIDSGIDATHPDLNVVGRADCVPPDLDPIKSGCVNNVGTYSSLHGTHVAGTIGALDNGFGVVGVAPGARLWSLKVFVPNANGKDVGNEAWTVGAIDWVTAHASEIEVANMSLGGAAPGAAKLAAIKTSVEAGVVYAVAAGNQGIDAKYRSPGNSPDVITVSALADHDGKPGGKSNDCGDDDDTLASFSNWGSEVEVAAPGTCILSTIPEGKYGLESGTSMATPHVAGAAAILASKSNPNSKNDAEAIRQQIVEEGSLNWTDDSGDGIQEPLLDLRAPTTEALTYPASGLHAYNATLNAVVSAGGLSSTYRFEYGTTSEYGTSVPASGQSIGSGVGDLKVSETIGLQPETTYHYRVAVTNSGGTVYGEDLTFKTSPWEIQDTPDPSPEDGKGPQLNGVSCTSSTFCMAVGKYSRKKGESDFEHPFAARWNGTSWSTTAIPLIPEGGWFEDISCTSSTSCVAVGLILKNARIPLSARWNGSEWSLVSVPVPSGTKGLNELRDISCTSATSCVAVGSYASEIGVPSSIEHKTLVETWNGSIWSIQSSANAAGMKINTLNGVSCSAANACTAVGSSKPLFSGKPVPLVERWNGSTWTIQVAAGPVGATESAFESVSCSSSTQCLAVGNTNGANGTVVNDPNGFSASWNGSEWQHLSSGLPGPFFGVSCLTATSCDAGGRTLARHWNGTEWSAEDFASPPGGREVIVRDLTCTGNTACVAVGSFRGSNATYPGLHALAERLTPAWAVQTTPAPPVTDESALEDISCSSSTQCWGVGVDNRNGSTVANDPTGLIERWDGSSWQRWVTGSAGPLYGVSCSTTTLCVAVGKKNGSDSALVERFTGTKWTIQSIPDPAGGDQIVLESVSCGTEADCIAVGHYHVPGAYKPLAMRWNGSAWSLQTVPEPSAEDGHNAELMSVSCSSATSCIAVGKYRKKSGSSTSTRVFAERWNGTSWSIMAIPAPPKENWFEDVSCYSASSCIAVGTTTESARTPISARWNGSEWSLLSVPVPSGTKGANELRDVSCTSATSCTAVGSYASEITFPLSNSEYKTLIETWNGSTWSIQASANAAGMKINALKGISCAESSPCTAVGSSKPIFGGKPVTLAERWNGGAWAVQTTPAPPVTDESALEDVSCSSSTQCWGVGVDNRNGSTVANDPTGLIERWDGSKWQQWIAGPAGPLHGVSCLPAASFCVAVGKKNGNGGTLAEHFTGTKWATQSTPNPAGGDQIKLEGVSCSSETACTAVGHYYLSGSKPLAMRWNGSTWSLQTVPEPSAEEGKHAELMSVSCASSTFCMAVGKFSKKNGGSNFEHVFAERWNGSTWAITAIPSPPAFSWFEDVACTSSTSCIAVGGTTDSGREAVSARWNGSGWSLLNVPVPSAEKGWTELRDVSCTSATSCIAVGTYATNLTPPLSNYEIKTLVENWNGSEWSVQASANAAGQKVNVLNGVSCTNVITCTAVGSAKPSQVTTAKPVTLAERWE